MNDLNLELSGDPGSARFGNFINYYDFHPADNRIKLLPKNYLDYISRPKDGTSTPVVCLDVGCNTGELTKALQKDLVEKFSKNPKKNHTTCEILAVDLDAILIERAKISNTNEHIEFCCADVLDQNFDAMCDSYLTKHNRTHFDIVYCFSMTMWIHINHGDEALKDFIVALSKKTDLLVIEPQPWKCYTRAVRRVKKSNSEPFKHFDSLKIRKGIETFIDFLLFEQCDFTKCLESAPTSWGRQVRFYKTNRSTSHEKHTIGLSPQPKETNGVHTYRQNY